MSGTLHPCPFPAGSPSTGPVPPAVDAAPFPLAQGRLHEIHAQGTNPAAALAFALCSGGAELGNTVWVQCQRSRQMRALPYGHGLAVLGIAPASLIVVETGNERDLMRAGLEAARCAGVARVLLETHGALPGYTLTASRRLALAAEQTRNCVIVLRHDACPRPSAAHTRWAVTSAPSRPLEAQAPGLPAVEAQLLRWRGGPAGQCVHFIWDADYGTFRDATGSAPLSGALVPLFRMRDDAHDGGPDHIRAA